MNQTKKRLVIIRLAISMTDTETIQLQVLKLGLLKTDSRIREILETLNARNYARAQRLISLYIDSDSETKVVQRTSQESDLLTTDTTLETETTQALTEAMIEKKESTIYEDEAETLSVKDKIAQAKNQAIIEQFELFEEEPNEEDDIYQDAESYDNFSHHIAPQPKKMSNHAINYDALLNVEANDVLPDNITLDIESSHVHVESSQQGKEIKEKTTQEEYDIHATLSAISNATYYDAIPYIEEKMHNMQNQYPPVEITDERSQKVNALLYKITNEGYSETDIEILINDIDTLSQENKAEAAQLLLLAAATKSPYAQFRLARGLYRGTLLQKNLEESFILMYRLAMNECYPEAICDLAQFYENGIGVERDKNKAEELYKEAMDAGIHRAIEHYERLRKKNRGILSIFKK